MVSQHCNTFSYHCVCYFVLKLALSSTGEFYLLWHFMMFGWFCTVRDTFCSYGVMELCTKGLNTSLSALRQRGVNLSCVRTLCVIAEERPRLHLTTAFAKLFSGLGLSSRAVSTSFGCRVNVGICLQVCYRSLFQLTCLGKIDFWIQVYSL